MEDKWTYKKRETHYVDDTGLADFYYNGNEMFVAGIGNFKEGKEDDGYIYDIALETDDCSIGGITPGMFHRKTMCMLKNTGNPQKSTFLRAWIIQVYLRHSESNQSHS